MKRSFSASTSLVRKIFTNYSSTFGAFCELINNSIQANAKNVWIDIDYVDEQQISPYIIRKIVIKDDGNGVFQDDINDDTIPEAKEVRKKMSKKAAPAQSYSCAMPMLDDIRSLDYKGQAKVCKAFHQYLAKNPLAASFFTHRF